MSVSAIVVQITVYRALERNERSLAKHRRDRQSSLVKLRDDQKFYTFVNVTL
ncbi:MAG: hypothetical protein ACAF41_06095 [Leptolyngbya sp. BL-A-14]